MVIFSFNLIFAAERKLEVEYPEFFGVKPKTIEEGLEVYGRYLFNLSVFITGIVLFISLIWGGIIYLISWGDPVKIKEAKERIVSAFFGVILLLSSYLILTTINPQLAMFRIKILEKKEVPEVTMKESKREKPTQIFYEIPLGQLLENGLWKDENVNNLHGLLLDFEGFLTKEFTLSPEKFEKISDLYKYLSSLTENCHCEELMAICQKPTNFANPIGCLGDPCQAVREKINKALDKSKEITRKLEAYREMFKKVVNVFEEEGRKYENLAEILEECKGRELLTRGEYYDAVTTIAELGGETELIKSYIPSKKEDPLVFYCSKGGTIYDYPYKVPEISPEELEKARESAPSEPVEKIQPLSCPGYIPLGSLIEGELVSISVTTNTDLEIILFYIEKLLEEITKMTEAVSQCNESRCNINCACDPKNPCFGKCEPPSFWNPNPCFFFCRSPCLQTVGSCYGEPCPREELKKIPQRIKMWEEELFKFINGIKFDIEDVKVILGKKGGGEVTLPEEGKVNIQIIRGLFQKCLSLGPRPGEQPEAETFWIPLRCDLALGNKGPDGKPILNCHPNDFFCCTNKSFEEAVKEFPEVKAVAKEAVLVPPPEPRPPSSIPTPTPPSQAQPPQVEKVFLPPSACEGTNFPHFSQHDPKWANEPYPPCYGPPKTSKRKTISRSGCGPTSMAMVLNYFGIPTDPIKEATWSGKNGYYKCEGGTAHAFCCARAKNVGLKCEVEYNVKNLLKEIENGKVAIVAGRGPPPYTKGGHYVVLTKVEEEWGTKRVYVNDPNNSVRRKRPPCVKLPIDFFFRNRPHFGCVIWR